MNWMTRFGFDLLLVAGVVANFVLLAKVRKLHREAAATREETAKAYRERTETMTGALENLACAACPLCASAAGRAVLGGPFGEMTAEAEIDGEHKVHVGVPGKVEPRAGVSPCLAAQVRADARQIFAEAMVEKMDKRVGAWLDILS